MSIDSGDILRFSLEFALADQVTGNLVTHFRAVSGTGGDEDIIHQAILDAWTAVLETNDTYTMSTCSSVGGLLWKYDMALHKFIGISQIADATFTGADASQGMPNQNAVQIDYFTGTPKRQGRKYIPGIAEAAFSSGVLVAGAVTEMVNIALILDNDVVADGVTIEAGVFSTDATSPYYETFDPFTQSTAVETYSATQRRRKPGVGI